MPNTRKRGPQGSVPTSHREQSLVFAMSNVTALRKHTTQLGHQQDTKQKKASQCTDRATSDFRTGTQRRVPI